MIMYELRREGNEWGPPRTYAEATKALKDRLSSSEGPFRILRPDDDDPGPPKTRQQTMRIVSSGLTKSRRGDVWKIFTEDGKGDFFAIRLVEVGLPEATPVFSLGDASPALARVARVAAGYDKGVRTAGIAYTRRVSGTSIWSQHSRWPRLGCKSNAIDLYFPLPYPVGNSLPRQRALVGYLLNHVDELDIDMIISEKTYWSREYGFQPRYYNGISHVSHTHIQMSPYQSGSPCGYG